MLVLIICSFVILITENVYCDIIFFIFDLLIEIMVLE